MFFSIKRFHISGGGTNVHREESVCIYIIDRESRERLRSLPEKEFS